MKTNLFYLSLAFTLLFAACKKEDDSTDVVGIWEISTSSNSNCNDPDDNGTLPISDGCIDLVVFSSCTDLEFKSDDSFEIRTSTTVLGAVDEDTESGTYSLEGNTITATFEDGTSRTFTYNADGPSISSSYEDDIDGCTVQQSFRKK